MKERILKGSFLLATFLLLASPAGNACTNFLITRGATVDGSTMISYSADSHVLYGELYFWPAMDYPAGSMMDIYEWDTGKFLGQIRQVEHTYSVVGNINEHQVAIGETTFGGNPDCGNPDGIVDYGALIYVTLQRAKNAREAIKIIAGLMADYGYYSSGESFSISDPNEAWIMELIGEGKDKKGGIWVARRIPDGYISGHANQARITTFPLANGKTSISSDQMDRIFDPDVETVYAAHIFDVARKFGYEGKDKDFSFSDFFAPMNFGAARFCEARVFSGFNKVNSSMGKYLDYAMGTDLHNRMPLWIKPDKKLTVHDVMGLMRDYYQGTPMDMTQDIGAGPYDCIVRWRPMTWSVDGKDYFNERAISTQQTGFSFIAQSRNWLPDPIGGIIWFGVDDTYSTVYTPMYCGMTEVPHAFAQGNGSMMEFSDDAAFWVFNQVSNFAYTRYNDMIVDIQARQQQLEKDYVASVPFIDEVAGKIFQKDPAAARAFITRFSVDAGNRTTAEWKKLYTFLFTKYLDGNVKTPRDVPEGYIYVNPHLEQPGYGEDWYRMIVRETGDKFRVPEGQSSH